MTDNNPYRAEPSRYDSWSTAHRPQRPQAPRDLPRPLAQLRRRQVTGVPAGDPAPGLRPRRHPLRPGEQLRTPPRSAELNFGKIFAQDFASYRDELIVSTKAGYFMHEGPYGEWGSRKYLMSSLDASLKRMGVDYVDIFYSHRFDPETPLEETMGALASAVQQGKALYVGVSSYTAEQTAEAAGILREMGVRPLIHQPSYSMINRWTEEDGLLDTLEEAGMGCISFAPLAQGCSPAST